MLHTFFNPAGSYPDSLPSTEPVRDQAARTIQKSFKDYMAGHQETCAICLEDDYRVNLKTICPRTVEGNGGHLFHRACAQEALMVKPECPACRVDLSNIDQAQALLRDQVSSAASNHFMSVPESTISGFSIGFRQGARFTYTAPARPSQFR